MLQVAAPATRDEIVASLDRLHSDSTAYWSQFDTATFFRPLGDAWSPAENARHLVKASRPVAQALSIPRALLAIRFGIALRPSMSYEALRAKYDGALAAGGKAGRFAPSKRDESDLESWRAQIMRERDQVHESLTTAIRRWPERALDRYRLPHPLLGKLTVREMLFFTLYHNLHHVEVVERRRAQ